MSFEMGFRFATEGEATVRDTLNRGSLKHFSRGRLTIQRRGDFDSIPSYVMPAPAERPYPYETLGLQPGDPLDDVLAVYAERSDAAPTSESEVLRVQSPDGSVFEFTYQLFTRIWPQSGSSY